MTVPSFFRSRTAVAGAVLYFVLSLVCTRIPLLNYLGYEFSFVVALVATFQAGFATISLVGSEYRAPGGDGGLRRRRVSRAYVRSLLFTLLLLGIPILVMLVNALFVRNCSLIEGIGFFLLLPAVTVFFACSVGLFCAVHYRFARTAYTAIVAATFAYALALGYFTPAIFSYNFFYGYFPGLTYDEELSLNGTLLLFRLLTVACGAVFAWMALMVARQNAPSDSVRLKGRMLALRLIRGRTGYAAVVIIAGALAAYWFRCDLGFESTESYIRSALGGEFRTKHFTLVYARGSFSEEEIRRIGAEHEFRLHQVMEALSLPNQEPITSFLYPSAEKKLRFIGAGNTDIAKPWRNEIHLTRQSWEVTLKHELVHVAAARFGIPVIRVSISTGLVEGLAMAIDWKWGNRTPHQYAAAMRKFGFASDIKPLMRFSGFAGQSTAMSYVQAGSFCRYLIDRYGIRKMMLLYRSGEYEHLYGRSLDELNGEWQAFLDRIPVAESDRDAVEALFRRPTIFMKTCARVIAVRNRNARTMLSRKDYGGAGALYRKSYEEGAGADALAGWLTCELHEGRYHAPATLPDSLLAASPTPGQYLPLLLVAGDACWALGEFDHASELFHRLAKADVSDRLSTECLLRLDALDDTARRTKFLSFFLSDRSDSLRLAEEDSLLRLSPASRFLLQAKAETLRRLGEFTPALEVLQSIRWTGGDERLEAMRLTEVGRALFRLRRFQEARVSFWLSLNSVSSPAARYDVDDWIERCDWMASHDF